MASKESSSRFHPYKKSKTPTKTKPREPSSGLSVNDLKKRIRDVKRLLSHADLTPEARIVQERALAGYEKDLKDETERRHRSEMIKRYHFVRFLDRKAATKELRRLTQQQKDMEERGADPTSLKAIKRKVHNAQISVNYTIYYPLSEKYISLYPHDKKKKTSSEGDDGDNSDNNAMYDDDTEKKKKKSHGNAKDLNEKPPIWNVVETCTAEGTLGRLRDGKLNIGFDGKPNAKPATASGRKQSDTKASDSAQKETIEKTSHRGAKRHDPGAEIFSQEDGEEDDESDGGFFEA